MSTLNIDGTFYDIPGIVIDADQSDEELVIDAHAAQPACRRGHRRASLAQPVARG